MIDKSSFTQPYRNFNGTLIANPKKRIYNLHNQITREETNYTNRTSDNYYFNSCLSEYFGYNLLDYLTNLFKPLSYHKNPFGKNILKLRMHQYLVAIHCIQVKNGIFIPNRTFKEIEKRFNTKINRLRFNYFYRLFAQKTPEFWRIYRYNKIQDFNNGIQFALTNKEKNGYSTDLIRDVHARTLEIANLVKKHRKFTYLKPMSIDYITRGIVSLAYFELTGSCAIPYNETQRIKDNIANKKYLIKNWIGRK